jgi:hypothetical protein
LLAAGHGLTEVRSRYLLGLALLGHLGSGDAARARAVWNHHERTVLQGRPPGLALAVLQAQAFAGEAARQP